MLTIARTLTMTTAAMLLAILLGVWLASTSPANSSAGSAAASMSVETRIGIAELDLCSGQAWPSFSHGCAAWISASAKSDGLDRTLSLAVHDADQGFTVAGKARAIVVAARYRGGTNTQVFLPN
jgi:hypothetical protein